MQQMSFCRKLLLENATSFAERRSITALTENEAHAMDTSIVTSLYKAALEKSHIDFDDIPNSKGDITAYSGYTSMMATLQTLKDLSAKYSTNIADVAIIETAISNITAYRQQFTHGFKMNKEFVMLQYNLLVAACVEALSTVISSYVDFVKRAEVIEFTIIKDTKKSGWLCIRNLSLFNDSVKKGDYGKLLNSVSSASGDNFVGGDDIIVGSIIIGSLLMIVPIIRELIFYFYYTRMQISDYLKHQAQFLELNRLSLEAKSNVPIKERNKIIKAQDQRIKLLMDLSDKIKVNHVTTEHKTGNELAKENKHYTVATVQSDSSSTDKNGFTLL